MPLVSLLEDITDWSGYAGEPLLAHVLYYEVGFDFLEK